MKNRLTHNLGLKLASVFSAVILWLVVTTINNPTVSDYYHNIPVKLLNTELITDSGQVYEVIDGTDTIGTVTVRAPHSVLSELKSENIIATADVSELSSLDTISIKLTTDISSKDISSITGNIDTVKLKIENKKTKALSLKATVSLNCVTCLTLLWQTAKTLHLSLLLRKTIFRLLWKAPQPLSLRSFKTQSLVSTTHKLFLPLMPCW